MTETKDPMRSRRPKEIEAAILSIWRSRSPQDRALGDVGAISRLLVRLGRASNPSETLDRLLTLAEGRTAGAWMTLADVLPREVFAHQELPDAERRDIIGSCLWLASARGFEWADVPLLFLMMETDCTKQDIARYANPTRWISYQTLVSLKEWGLGPVLEHFRTNDPQVVEEWFYREQPEANAFVGTRLNSWSAPTLRVLVNAPEPASQASEKVLIERYKRLTTPVRLVQMPDPKSFTEDLMESFPWFSELFIGIRKELSLARSLGRQHFWLEPRLLVGPSGIGKTLVANTIATCAGAPIGKVLAAGSADNRALAGTARGWSSAQPALPICVIRQHMVANPVIVVDEIDKATGSGQNGRIQDTLLTMLDPGTNDAWQDDCLLTEADLSAITWILTANHIHLVPATLRARCIVVHMQGPRPEDFDVLFQGILDRIAVQYAIPRRQLPDLSREVVGALREGFVAGRLQARQLAALVRNALAMTAEGERAMAN